jgi:hypothetical protein
VLLLLAFDAAGAAAHTTSLARTPLHCCHVLLPGGGV